MKTIAITSFHTLISRNILATPVLEILCARKDLRVVLVVPDYKIEYFKANFGRSNVQVCGIKQYQSSKTFCGLLFKRLGYYLFNSETAKWRKKYDYYHNRKLVKYLFAVGIGYLGNFLIIRALVRFLDLHLSPRQIFKGFFDKYKPDAIFSTDIQNENDVSLMQEARRRRVPILGMLRSWDHITHRINRVLPDRLIAGSNTLKDEVIEYYQYPKEKISVTGNPHYDRYLNGPSKPREEFFRYFGLNPKQNLVFYAPGGSLLIKNNDLDQYVMETLGEISEQVLVRLPLGGDVPLINFNQPKNMAIDRPGVRFVGGGELELSIEDDQRLIDSLYYSDLVITGPTSIPLDAAFFDKPSILADFYPTPRPIFDAAWTYNCTHIQKLISTGGVEYINDRAVFLKRIDEYLKDFSIKKEGRMKIRSMWFSHIDGHSAERLAGGLLRLL